MLQSSSLSWVEPNFTNWGSSAFLNRSLVVLSKHLTIWPRSSRKSDSARNPIMVKVWAGWWLQGMNLVPSRNSRHRMLTKTEPWRWPEKDINFNIFTIIGPKFTLGLSNLFEKLPCCIRSSTVRTNIYCSTTGINDCNTIIRLFICKLTEQR